MTYVFSRTGGDAQKHLQPRYDEDSEDLFLSDKEMINHLASIYEDPYKVQNACFEYKGLLMKLSETFADFNTRFLHLAGQAKIPKEDLRPDLFDKLTLDLQRTVLPVYSTLTTVKSLADECLSLDQGLRRIKVYTDWAKAQTATFTDRKAPVTPARATTRADTDRSSPATARNLSATPTRTFSQEATPNYIRLLYLDSAIQSLSDRDTCFIYSLEGHFATDCLQKGKDKTLVVQEVDAESEDTESENKEPWRKTPLQGCTRSICQKSIWVDY